MSKFLAVVIAMLLCTTRALALNVDAFIDEKIAPITDAIADVIFFQVSLFGTKIPVIILWILVAGIFFTIYFKGICIWGFKHAIDIVVKPADKSKGDCGDVSSFQALATALSGTIGIGSIAGVAISISIGGPGAAFWIFAGALLGLIHQIPL